MKNIKVDLGERSYDIHIGSGVIARAGGILRRLDPGTDALIVTNRFLKNRFSSGIRGSLGSSGISVKIIEVPDSETAKSIKCAWALVEKIARMDVHRRIFLVALGGGVIGDLTGFVAAVYKRGIPYVQVPTTLLSQVDSSIGGKTGIDLVSGKNLCGAFYQPIAVISDIALLRELPARQIRAGLSEAVKYGLIMDKDLFRLIEKEYVKLLSCDRNIMEPVVRRCAALKAGIVSRDEREKKGLRTILNFGHTVAHAIEQAGRYSLYGHGEALALGMAAEADISRRLGLLSSQDHKRIAGLIKAMGLPSRITGIGVEPIMRAQAHDKKFSGKVNRFVLIKGIGKALVRENIPERVIRDSLKALRK
ncbi:MAG: 3-dehydroquinate synthase [Candidatus Omnitrophica bacterium]|nr:3-dehydroquinate synthase [Candidatus Omnitrophota bacterium]